MAQERLTDFEEICKIGEGSFGSVFAVVAKFINAVSAPSAMSISAYFARNFLVKPQYRVVRLSLVKLPSMTPATDCNCFVNAFICQAAG